MMMIMVGLKRKLPPRRTKERRFLPISEFALVSTSITQAPVELERRSARPSAISEQCSTNKLDGKYHFDLTHSERGEHQPNERLAHSRSGKRQT